jgi:hypothetical protein
MIELRCGGNKVHGVLLHPATGGVVEVKCGSRWCGAGDGIVVLHQFSCLTGELLNSVRFREPSKIKGSRKVVA